MEKWGRPEPTVPGLVQRLARRNSRVLTRALAAAGMADLTSAQAMLLARLGRGGHASDLADRIQISRQAVAQAIGALERGDYVRRADDPADRRAKTVSLTDRGRFALRVIRAAGIAEQERWAKTLGPDRMADLRSSLADLLDAQGRPSRRG